MSKTLEIVCLYQNHEDEIGELGMCSEQPP